jgi:hypothetical protein
MKPEQINLTETANIYLIANTPIFLIRRLQADSSVYALAQLCTASDLYDAIVSSLAKPPEDPIEAVRPFAFLVALRIQNCAQLFYKAAELPAPHLPWFSTVARMLGVTFVPNANVTMTVTPPPSLTDFSGSTTRTVASGVVEVEALTC